MSFSRTTARSGKATPGAGKGTTVAPPAAKKPVISAAASTRSKPTVSAAPVHRSAHDALHSILSGVEDVSFDDSFDDASWEADMQSRQTFLQDLVGLNSSPPTVTSASTGPPIIRASPSPPPAVASRVEEVRGLDDEDEEEKYEEEQYESEFASPAAAPASSSSPQTVVVASLFDIAVAALGQHYHAIAAQDVAERLPPGTLSQAIAAVRKAGLLTDHHLPLLFRTLTRSATVSSRTWLEQDCGLDALVSSALEADEEESTPTASASPPAPSSSSSATAAASATRTTSKPVAKTKVPAAGTPASVTLPPVNSRFAPLRGTPGVSSGHSMNTATLARAAKAAKVAAQIAAENLQPHAKPRVNNQVAQVNSVRVKSSSRVRGIIPKEYLIASGELLDLHAQHKISEYGFRLLTGFMAYTRQKADGVLDMDQEDVLLTSDQLSAAEEHFTEEQRRRLASIGVSEELRALVRHASPSSNGVATFAPASVSSSASGIPRPVLDLAQRLGIWRPVNIINLDISFSGIDSAGLQMVARHCPNLLKVNICGCERITNSGVSFLARHCRQVQVLLMEVLPCLDDSAVQDVIHGMKQLLSLDVGSCRKISNVSFQIIGTHGKTLKRLSAAGCHQTTVRHQGNMQCNDIDLRAPRSPPLSSMWLVLFSPGLRRRRPFEVRVPPVPLSARVREDHRRECDAPRRPQQAQEEGEDARPAATRHRWLLAPIRRQRECTLRRVQLLAHPPRPARSDATHGSVPRRTHGALLQGQPTDADTAGDQHRSVHRHHAGEDRHAERSVARAQRRRMSKAHTDVTLIRTNVRPETTLSPYVLRLCRRRPLRSVCSRAWQHGSSLGRAGRCRGLLVRAKKVRRPPSKTAQRPSRATTDERDRRPTRAHTERKTRHGGRQAERTSESVQACACHSWRADDTGWYRLRLRLTAAGPPGCIFHWLDSTLCTQRSASVPTVRQPFPSRLLSFLVYRSPHLLPALVAPRSSSGHRLGRRDGGHQLPTEAGHPAEVLVRLSP